MPRTPKEMVTVAAKPPGFSIAVRSRKGIVGDGDNMTIARGVASGEHATAKNTVPTENLESHV
jgi:hypothetical protein